MAQPDDGKVAADVPALARLGARVTLWGVVSGLAGLVALAGITLASTQLGAQLPGLSAGVSRRAYVAVVSLGATHVLSAVLYLHAGRQLKQHGHAQAWRALAIACGLEAVAMFVVIVAGGVWGASLAVGQGLDG